MKRSPALALAAIMLLASSTGRSPAESPSQVVVASIAAMAPGRPVQPVTGTTLAGGSLRQRKLAEWAVGRFETAGLELPPLRLELHDDTARCDGNRGTFSPSRGTWVVAVCVDDHMTLLHELGHAWMEHTLSQELRDAYVAERDLESWNDPGTPWRRRGSEDAADTLAWGLREGEIGSFTAGGPLARRNAAFRLLTGFDAPVVP